MNTVNLETLQKALLLLCSALSNKKMDVNSASVELELSYDFYWSVTLGKRCDMHQEPQVDIGSIEHDIERVCQFVTEQEPYTHLYRCLGNILIAVADTLDEQDISLLE